MDDCKIYDVLIIGAGLSGTSAGYYLKKNNKNLSILIVEAKNRTGGRTQTIELKSKNGKTKFDCGGQWVTDTQTYVTRLLKEFNIETYKQYDEGINVLESYGKIIKYNSQIPRISLPGLIDLQLIISKINRNAAKISTVEPFSNYSNAIKFDSTNIKEFLYKNSFIKSSKSIIDAAIRTIYGLEPNQINTLFGLMYVKSGNGTIESLALTEPNCAQEKKIKGGAQQISERLLKYILETGAQSKALFEHPIIGIDQENDIVKVKVLNTQKNKEEVYLAKKIISSIPLNQYDFIKFKPELPFYKKNVFNSCKVGNYIKVLVTYKKAFWKEKGYSGAVISDGSIIYHDNGKNPNYPILGPISIMYDATTNDDEPALVAFIAGNAAVEWSDQSEEIRRIEIIQAFVRYFGPDAEDYIEFYEKNWNKEPYNGGCPTYNIVMPGVTQDYARATREPFINIHFCGTESATKWQGYMDGAVESGYRAANEILYNLSNYNSNIKADYESTYYYQEKEIKKAKLEQIQYSIKAKKSSSTNFFVYLILLSIISAIIYKYIFT